MSSRISRRSLVSGASALGAGAALSVSLAARAQSTPQASPAAGVSPAQEAVIQEIQEMGGSLRILSAVVGGKTPEEDELFAQEITRLTGVEVELVHPTADYEEKLLADLAAGVEYDLIYMNKNRMDVLVADGILTDLTERIQGSELLQDPMVIPTEEWELISYDGAFYSVFNKFEGARMLTTRQDWLDQLGLEQPRTLDEVYNVMVAFRDENPAGTDTPPLGLSTAGTYDIQPFMSSEGVFPGYVMNGDARTIPYATEAAIPVYQWLADLYAEGLYDQNFATATTADMRNLFFTDAVGFVTYWDTWVGLFNNTARLDNPDFNAVGIAATEGPEGIIITRGQPSVWTIPVNAPNPDLAFKFLEWWNTIPGITVGSLGILDHDYTVTDGSYELTEVGTEHSMDHGNPTPYSEYWQNPIGTLPGLEEAQAISREYGYLEQLGPDWEPTIKPILDETILQMILGDVTPEDGVASMHEQLLSQGLID
ncbi:MAG TPA: extracellular solute-binding protein, partial [Thermomicrobiales bacterium]|nr:extracellular solute-binding protein [Thermomicrobiales bacterium]